MRWMVACVFFWCVAGVAFGVAASIRSFIWTPVITADAYADGDQIGVLQKLTGLLPGSSGGVEVMTVTLVDAAKLKRGLDVLLFSRAITVASADNAAVSISDAEMASGFVGRLAFASSDYQETTSNADVTKAVSMILRGDGSNNLWALLVCRDAAGCDYGSTSDLTMRLAYYE